MPIRSLALLLSDVPTAAAYRYGAMDSLGHRMDTAKVIQSPAGGYLAVYHSGPGLSPRLLGRPGDVDAPWGRRRAGNTASDRHGPDGAPVRHRRCAWRMTPPGSPR
jgi:hypothetical protein